MAAQLCEHSKIYQGVLSVGGLYRNCISIKLGNAYARKSQQWEIRVPDGEPQEDAQSTSKEKR